MWPCRCVKFNLSSSLIVVDVRTCTLGLELCQFLGTENMTGHTLCSYKLVHDPVSGVLQVS